MKSQSVPGKVKMQTSKEIGRRRLMYSLVGGALGAGLVVLIRWLLGYDLFSLDVVYGAVAGSGWVLHFAQKYRGLSTEDLGLMQMREEMGPNDMTPDTRIPRTLRTKE